MLKKLYVYNKLIAALILTLSSVCSLLMPPVANATSIYDGAYQTTSTISLSNTASGSRSACSSVNYSANWLALFDEASNPYSSQQAVIDNLKASYLVASENGRWGISQFEDSGAGIVGIHIYWTEDTSLSLSWQGDSSDYFIRPTGNNLKSISFVTQAAWFGNSNCEPYVRFDLSTYPPFVSDEIGIHKSFFVYTDNPNYPSGYEGGEVYNSNQDDDELTFAQETAQGTSDNKKDTDDDGLRDDVESVWYPNRDEVFCGSSECAYPNPAQRDLYVEIDWMNDGSREYKPTSSQLETVVDTFENQDIVAHFDSGQYGGGNQLPALTQDLVFESTEDELDFYDLKNGTSSINRQFAENRKDIWRYMITGQNFIREYDGATPKPGTTGSAYAGNDDSIISIEKIETEFPVDILHPSPAARNAAISGTILHELGHNLCLSDTSYPGQSPSCLYQGIDNNSGQPPINDPDEYYDLEDYESVMNYRYQFNRADYSHGTNGSFHDHDDWSAIAIGMNDFVGKTDPSESTFFRGFIQQPED